MNDWSFWQAALENPKLIGKTPELIVTTEPKSGFYKSKFKGKAWEPVALWQDEDGNWQARRGGRVVEITDDLWTYCVRQPITHEAYEQALRDGTWDEDDPTVAAAMAGIGHNVGDVDELDILKDQIESARQGAEVYAEITSDDQAAKAQSLRARLNELAGTADKRREALKKPHFEAGKAIDKDWMPLVKEAKAVADQIKAAIAAHETRKLAEQRRLEAERQRLEQERLAGEESEPLPPPPPPLVADTIKGSYGRAASVGVEKVVTAITDQDALYQYMRDHIDLRTCLLNLAQRAVKSGREVPGVQIEERASVR